MVKFTRRQIIRGELDNAINLYLSEGDPISAHVLASAATKVLQGLADHRGLVAFIAKAEKSIRPDKMKIWRGALNRHYNFFKHSDRDPVNETDFNPESTAFLIMAATEDYFLLFEQLSLPMALFRGYFVKTYPDSLEAEFLAQLTPVFAFYEEPGKTPQQVAAHYVALARKSEFTNADALPAGIEV